jgi:uncharacterized protein (TIGR02328 family)
VRIWHYQLLPYLPDAQFKGQLRELVAIMHDWRDKGKTNHILINRVMEYPKSDLTSYMWLYCEEHGRRYDLDCKEKLLNEFIDFAEGGHFNPYPFKDWHNKEYLRVCMANLYEKHVFGVGKSRISDAEWETLLKGYKDITGEEYII